MRKTMKLWVLVTMAVCVFGGFAWYNGTLNRTIAELQEGYAQSQLRIGELENEQQELKSKLATANTDAFIENQARTVYGYMMQDEIRFVITNPEVLYGDEEVPSR